MDLDRAYVINGDDLRIALASPDAKPFLVGSPREMAEHILRTALVRDVVIVSHGQLARALDGVTVWCKPDGGQAPDHTFAGKITNAEAVARRVLGVIARPAPGCDCMADPAAVADPELTAMTVAVACLEPLDMEAQARVMHWLLDRFHVDL